MLWFKQEANLTASYASKARVLTMLPTGAYIAIIVISLIGLALIIVAIVLYLRYRNKTDDTEPILPEDDGEIPIPTET